MKNFILLLCTALTFLIAGCTGADGGISENSHADSSVLDLTRPIQPPADLADKRVLVAFFSRTGKWATLKREIHTLSQSRLLH